MLGALRFEQAVWIEDLEGPSLTSIRPPRMNHQWSNERTNDRFLGALIAKDVMTRNVAMVDPNTPIEEANRIFLENLLHALPVIEESQLIGIITTHDLLKFYSELVAGQKLIEKTESER